MATTTRARKTIREALPLHVQEFSTSQRDYPMHEVMLRRAGTEMPTGGYTVKRDERGYATAGEGLWWVGIGWSSASEQGPYLTLTDATRAVEQDQVLTPALVKAGFGSV